MEVETGRPRTMQYRRIDVDKLRGTMDGIPNGITKYDVLAALRDLDAFTSILREERGNPLTMRSFFMLRASWFADHR